MDFEFQLKRAQRASGLENFVRSYLTQGFNEDLQLGGLLKT